MASFSHTTKATVSKYEDRRQSHADADSDFDSDELQSSDGDSDDELFASEAQTLSADNELNDSEKYERQHERKKQIVRFSIALTIVALTATIVSLASGSGNESTAPAAVLPVSAGRNSASPAAVVDEEVSVADAVEEPAEKSCSGWYCSGWAIGIYATLATASVALPTAYLCCMGNYVRGGKQEIPHDATPPTAAGADGADGQLNAVLDVSDLKTGEHGEGVGAKATDVSDVKVAAVPEAKVADVPEVPLANPNLRMSEVAEEQASGSWWSFFKGTKSSPGAGAASSPSNQPKETTRVTANVPEPTRCYH